MPRHTGIAIREQRPWVAFAILALLLLVSTAASAQTTATKTNETHDWAGSVDNFCNGDVVTVSGKHHVMASQQDQKNGRVHLQMSDRKNGTGVGAPSGKQYSYGDQTRMNVIVPAAPDGQPTGIMRQRIKIVSGGSTPEGDNFFATFVTPPNITFSPAPSR